MAVVYLNQWVNSSEWVALNGQVQPSVTAVYAIIAILCPLFGVQMALVTWDVRSALVAMKVNDPLVFTAPLGCRGACTAERRMARREASDQRRLTECNGAAPAVRVLIHAKAHFAQFGNAGSERSERGHFNGSITHSFTASLL